MAPKHNKNKNLLFVAIAVAVILIILAAGLGYLYLDGQNKQNQKREELKQAFSDQRNETERQYTLIGAYPAAGNKNYVDDFQKWVDGYRKLADNYSLAVSTLLTEGGEYKLLLANDSSDYAGVTEACNEASNKARSINSTAAGYEKDCQSRLGLKTNASAALDLALNRSRALYDTAWNYMQQDAANLMYGGYLAYLRACDLNNSYYNNSIGLAQSAGATYQTYLKGNEYYAVNDTIADLQDDASKLGRRYAELQKVTVKVDLLNEEINTAWSADKGFYKTVSFVLLNENKRNNTLPAKIWDVVVHYKLIDAATGTVVDTCDVPVTVTDYYMTDVHTGILKCDPKKEDYKTEYSITFEY
jgi:type II secretory pathway pseudopilin PulG